MRNIIPKELLTENRKENTLKELIIEPRKIGAEVNTSKEIWQALKSSKNGQAAGPGDIRIELVRTGSDIATCNPHEQMYVLDGDEIPDDGNIGYMRSICKEGNTKICENHHKRDRCYREVVWQTYENLNRDLHHWYRRTKRISKKTILTTSSLRKKIIENEWQEA